MQEQDADPLVTFDWTAFDSPGTAVVTAVAEEEDVDPVTIEPLYDAVDADALNDFVASTSYPRGSPTATIEFTYREYRVLVKANGRGYIYDRSDRLGATPDPRSFEAPK